MNRNITIFRGPIEEKNLPGQNLMTNLWNGFLSFFFYFEKSLEILRLLRNSTRVNMKDGKGNGNPIQYFCLENHMVRGAWQATIYGVERVGQD